MLLLLESTVLGPTNAIRLQFGCVEETYKSLQCVELDAPCRVFGKIKKTQALEEHENRKLTEKDGQVLSCAGQGFEGFGRYVLDHVLVLAGSVLVLYQPFQHVFLAHQIACKIFVP